MIAIKILLGLIGLGVVVFVHELGHFLAARLCGIDVEAFSIGWGKPILRKKIGTVEYRLGLFPLGGYCKMRGDGDYEEFWNNKKDGIDPSPGSFFAAQPWKRIIAVFAGPLFNFIFAIIVLSVIWGRGIEIKTWENKIVLLADIDGQSYPSDKGGLLSGDRIIAINGKEITAYRDIQEHIALNPDKDIPITVNRNGEHLFLTVHSSLDKTGMGKIGIYPWTTPLIQAIQSGRALQPAEITELLGDPTIQYKTPTLSPIAAFASGGSEAAKTFAIIVKSMGLLFNKGIDLTQAVSGPVRITYMIGDIAAGGFEQNAVTGFLAALNFLALISIALCMMNLLPLPIIDGGMIILYMVEMLTRRPIHPKAVSVFQTAGFAIIFCLMIFAFFNDILFFVSR